MYLTYLPMQNQKHIFVDLEDNNMKLDNLTEDITNID